MAYVALLDANVLHPWVLCDLLLRLAERGLFRPTWSRTILEETIRSIMRRRPDLTEEQLSRRLAAMEAVFPEASVTNLGRFRAAVPPEVDEEDRHVVAAALAARADVIVTQDRHGLPVEALAPLGILVQHPDEFLVHQWRLDHIGVVAELAAMSAVTTRPPLSPADVLEALERFAPRFVETVRASDEYGEAVQEYRRGGMR